MSDPHTERLHGVTQAIRICSNIGCENSRYLSKTSREMTDDRSNMTLCVEPCTSEHVHLPPSAFGRMSTEEQNEHQMFGPSRPGSK
jgi:hypothetical protein